MTYEQLIEENKQYRSMIVELHHIAAVLHKKVNIDMISDEQWLEFKNYIETAGRQVNMQA